MSPQQHSPLPWRIDSQDSERILDAGYDLVTEDIDHRNARLIVTAVNAHTDMLVAVKSVLANDSTAAWGWLKAAIRKAEESAR